MLTSASCRGGSDGGGLGISGIYRSTGKGTGSAHGSSSGGARGQTVEIMKTFAERCPEVTITSDKAKAEYIVLFDHEGGKGYAMKDNKIAVFKTDGDLLFSHSTRSLGNAVKDACTAILK